MPTYPPNPHKTLAIFGATGSIGQSTLDVVRLHPDKFALHSVSGFSQVDKLAQICHEFAPKFVCLPSNKAEKLQELIKDTATKIVVDDSGLCQLASCADVDMVVAAIVGSAGLRSTMSAVSAGKTVLLANKESLVMAGDLLMQTAQKTGAVILPIDSEHNALFQCLPYAVQNDRRAIFDDSQGVKHLWLTASGGAFLHKSMQDMENASVADAINHPNWSMGQKISVDSSTMMNKGFEMIEACHLFGVPPEFITVVIHPQSVVHSLVEYTDGSFLAQWGTPDMKTPIAYALAYPNRMASGAKPLDLTALSSLDFMAPDMDKFACLSLAYRAMQTGQGACIGLNASNEVAVSAFLDKKIALTDIAVMIEQTLDALDKMNVSDKSYQTIEAIFELDKTARQLARQIQDNLIKVCRS